MASAFIIENTAGTLSISLAPGQLDGPGSSQRTTDAHLYGLGALSWGEGMDINILRLLESFACPDKGELGSPVSITGIPQDENDLGSVRRGINNPIPGQQWFNTTNNKMYVYYREEVGSPPTVQEGWKLNSNVVVSTDQPSNPKPGDLWLDTTQTDNCNSHMLKVYRSIGGSPEVYDFVAITENSVSKCGDTMTGFLELHADPTNPMHAATKQYVDDEVASAAGNASTALTAHASNTNLHITTNQNTFLDNFESAGTITGSISSDLHAMTGYTSNAGSVYTNIDSRVLRSGDTMTGNLNMGNQRITNVGDPTFSKDAAHKQYVDQQIIQSSFPTGAVIPFVTSFAPPGWLSCDGGVYDISSFPELAAILGTQYGGNGFTTFAVPDLRGEFIRGWDNGRGVDAGRNINTWQDHQFQDHYHNIARAGADNATSAHSGTGSGINQTGYAASGNRGAETRPRNFALHLCIKT